MNLLSPINKTTKTKGTFLNRIPQINGGIYKEVFGSHLVLYNPQFNKGVTVLENVSRHIVELMDGKKTINHIYNSLYSEDKSITVENILHIIQRLIDCGIVSIGDPLPNTVHLEKKGDVFSVWFHITNQCNLRCTYCYLSKTAEKMEESVGKNAISNIISNAHKVGFKKVHFTFAGGECLLEKEKISVFAEHALSEAKKNQILVGFGLITNGTLISNESILFLKKYHIDLTISLDGIKEYNDKQRVFANGTGTYKYIEAGMSLLKKKNMKFGVNIVITKNNIAHIPEFTKYLLKNSIFFTFIFFRANSFAENNLTPNNSDLIKYLKLAYKEIKKIIPRYKISDYILDYVTLSNPGIFKCSAGRNYIAVDCKGRVSPCAMHINMQIGDANKKNVIEKMKKPPFLSVDQIDECDNCMWKYMCSGGCAAHTFNARKTYKAKSPYCTVYEALIPDIIEIEARRIIKYTA